MSVALAEVEEEPEEPDHRAETEQTANKKGKARAKATPRAKGGRRAGKDPKNQEVDSEKKCKRCSILKNIIEYYQDMSECKECYSDERGWNKAMNVAAWTQVVGGDGCTGP